MFMCVCKYNWTFKNLKKTFFGKNFFELVENNEKNESQLMNAQYIYSAQVSGVNGYIQKTQYNKLQTINKRNLQEIEEGKNPV